MLPPPFMDPQGKYFRTKGRNDRVDIDDPSAALRRLPTYVYLTELFRGRHVVEIGCLDGLGALQLARAGAASVLGLDRSADAIARANERHRLPNLEFSVADYGSIDLADRSVDIVCVPSGVELVRWPVFLEEVRRILAPGGRLVVTAASADAGYAGGIGYHDLAGRLASLFGGVRMIGVTPFVGYALVEYADTEVLDVELDTSLVGGPRDAVTDYVAIAGTGLGAPRGYALVELPTVDGLAVLSGVHGFEATNRQLADRLASAETIAADALGRITELEARPEPSELEALRSRMLQAEQELERVAAQSARQLADAGHAVTESEARYRALEGELAGRAAFAQRLAAERDQLAQRLGELDAEMHTRVPRELTLRAAAEHQAEMRARAAELAERDAYAEELRHELDEVAAAQRAAVEAAREASMRAAELETEARALRIRAASAEGELLRRDREAAVPRGPDPMWTARVDELERQLAEKSSVADKATTRWKDAESKSDELWRKIGELQKELVATREQGVETARQQRQAAQIALTRAVDEASKKLVSSQDHALRTEKERQELEREAVALRARIAELDRETVALRARIAELESERGRAQVLEASELESERGRAQVLEASEREQRERGDRLEASEREQRERGDRLEASEREQRERLGTELAQLSGAFEATRAALEERYGELVATRTALERERGRVAVPTEVDPEATPRHSPAMPDEPQT